MPRSLLLSAWIFEESDELQLWPTIIVRSRASAMETVKLNAWSLHATTPSEVIYCDSLLNR
jgi:hypothetical protein